MKFAVDEQDDDDDVDNIFKGSNVCSICGRYKWREGTTKEKRKRDGQTDQFKQLKANFAIFKRASSVYFIKKRLDSYINIIQIIN